MNKELLLKLAALLDVVPSENFAMNNYARTAKPMRGEPRCATSACALGWATIIPECELELVAKRGDHTAFVRRVHDHESCSEEAAMQSFDISYRDAVDLFLDGFHMTAKEKAEQIRQLVRRG